MKKLILLGMLIGAFAAIAAEPFRIMTYNIRHGEGMDGKLDFLRIATVIKNESPRFVGLQEVDMKTKRVNGADTCATLAKETGLNATFCKSINYDGGEYGNALLSREKPLSVKRIPLPSKKEPRSLLLCEFEDCWVGTMHPEAYDASDNLASVPIVKKAVMECGSTKPVFVTGDWNATPTSQSVTELKKFLKVLSPQDKTTLLSSATAVAGENKGYCIDYIAIDTAHQSTHKVLSGKLVEGGVTSVASDHLPLVVEVVPRQARSPFTLEICDGLGYNMR